MTSNLPLLIHLTCGPFSQGNGAFWALRCGPCGCVAITLSPLLPKRRENGSQNNMGMDGHPYPEVAHVVGRTGVLETFDVIRSPLPSSCSPCLCFIVLPSPPAAVSTLLVPLLHAFCLAFLCRASFFVASLRL